MTDGVLYIPSSLIFWEIKEKHYDSWFWKALLKLRSLAKHFISCNIGNGSTAWFCFDKWTPLSPLIDCLGAEGPRRLRIPLNSRVRDACNMEGWVLAIPRSDLDVSLQIYLSTIELPSHSTQEDTYEWGIDGQSTEKFSASKTWEVLRPRDLDKDWAELVWFKGSTPKHAFNFWVTNLNRLPTMARLASWGLQVSDTCCLCSAAVETRDHLFLHCTFTQVIWTLGLRRLSQQSSQFSSWSSLLSWAKGSNPTSPSTLRLLLTQTIVYSVWRERNNRIHNHTTIPPLNLFKDIDRQITNTIAARKERRKFRNLFTLWFR
ncbi:PREDICTED: uncharacterized protein LOC104728327 [Camelina sativa]|uniref:Uncharacterized protein LOC104728327 n=1 Tax=Camelina sativa TaxID=90675 RepID=A0ABM0USM3_CAMSA|nr:PREDICTED: uncharacterized protein LOC104728327 [Camelina sativa]